MKILRYLLLIAALAPALVVVGATRALACSCVPPEPDRAALKDAGAVFTGTLAAIEPGVDIGFDRVTWTFAVEQVFKGEVGESQDVRSHTQSAACGLVFKEEKRYVVFAYLDEDRLQTNICTNTRPLAEGKELKLEPIAEYSTSDATEPGADVGGQDEGSRWRDPLVIGVAGVVVVAGLVTVGALVARRRRIP